MTGITITIRDSDQRNCLSFDLKDVLAAIREHVEGAWWRLSNVEALGGEAPMLEQLSDSHRCISSSDLQRVAATVNQVIDGEFQAYRNREDESPFLIVRAVDSTAYDVVTEKLEILSELQRRFVDVRRIDGRNQQ